MIALIVFPLGLWALGFITYALTQTHAQSQRMARIQNTPPSAALIPGSPLSSGERKADPDPDADVFRSMARQVASLIHRIVIAIPAPAVGIRYYSRLYPLWTTRPFRLRQVVQQLTWLPLIVFLSTSLVLRALARLPVLQMLAAPHTLQLPATLFAISSLILSLATALYLSHRWRHRYHLQRTQVLYALPDLFDFFALSLAAGSTLDTTLHWMEDLWPPAHPLADLLPSLRQFLTWGQSYTTAFAQWANQFPFAPLAQCATMVAQAEQFGTSLATPFHTMAQQLRDDQRRTLRTRTSQLPIKMTIPLVFLLMPAFLLILIGPAILTLWQHAL